MYCNFSLPANLSNRDSFMQLSFKNTVPHNEGFHQLLLVRHLSMTRTINVSVLNMWRKLKYKNVLKGSPLSTATYTMTQTSGLNHPEFLYLYSTMTFVSKRITTFAPILCAETPSLFILDVVLSLYQITETCMILLYITISCQSYSVYTYICQSVVQYFGIVSICKIYNQKEFLTLYTFCNICYKIICHHMSLIYSA